MARHGPVTVVGAIACVMRAVREIAAALIRRGEWRERPGCAICEAGDGRWRPLPRSAMRELKGEDDGARGTALAPCPGIIEGSR